MERTASNFDFKILEVTLAKLDSDHSSSALSKIKNELNKFFIKAKCKDVFYTVNTDKLFFGMRVYPVISGEDTLRLLGDEHTEFFEGYYVEIDSKLLDPMLYLEPGELVALLLHEIGHIAYDTDTIDEVRAQIDSYFARSGESFSLKSSKGLRELFAYALKDAVMKTGSIFAKLGNTEMVADSFVAACGYGPELESAMKKIVSGISYMRQEADTRFIALSWALRIAREFDIFRIPAIRTLNKAIQLTGSNLEKKELKYTSRVLSTMDEPVSEGAWENVANFFSKKAMEYKRNGIKGIKNDVYELNLRLRAAEDMDELMSIIRSCNTKISILQDYLTEDIPDYEREDVLGCIQMLYDIRQKASSDKQIKSRYSGYIQVTYPGID